MAQRKFMRHPSDVPINVEGLKQYVAHETEYLQNISHGGLAFESRHELALGQVINVSLPLVRPVFTIKGRVIWCRPNDGNYDIGVEFIEPEKIFKARMVEQVCQIEHYKREVREREGRELTGEQAALEWIKKYACDFPEVN